MPFDRAAALRHLADEQLDVLVVGGGITGAGVAVDAAARGLRTGLVERHDFASGTSSKSSKLVHGGLRYLQQREFRLVYEALAERQRLRHTAPHLVRLLPFLIPVFGRGGVINPKLAKALNSALWMYDLTGGARIGKLHERITAEETLAHMPTLRRDRVVSGFVYHDAQTDDARLTLALARTAADLGAAVVNWTAVTGFQTDADGTVTGATIQPHRGGQGPEGDPITVRATVVVNAAGVWSDDVAALHLGHDPTRSGRPRASTSPCRGTRCATTSPRWCRCPSTVDRSSSCPRATAPTSARPTRTTTGRSTSRCARPRTCATCSTPSTRA
jgi:glycerol-3-phosphate dehydrogenase